MVVAVMAVVATGIAVCGDGGGHMHNTSNKH
jgi:hypothetical protein